LIAALAPKPLALAEKQIQKLFALHRNTFGNSGIAEKEKTSTRKLYDWLGKCNLAMESVTKAGDARVWSQTVRRPYAARQRARRDRMITMLE
jgi:hypothetical protein